MLRDWLGFWQSLDFIQGMYPRESEVGTEVVSREDFSFLGGMALGYDWPK